MHGLLAMLRDAETDFRRSYARVLDVVTELEQERTAAVAGFGTTAGLLAGVLNLSKTEAKARVEQAGLLTPRQSLTGDILPPVLPSTAAELVSCGFVPVAMARSTSLGGWTPKAAPGCWRSSTP